MRRAPHVYESGATKPNPQWWGQGVGSVEVPSPGPLPGNKIHVVLTGSRPQRGIVGVTRLMRENRYLGFGGR